MASQRRYAFALSKGMAPTLLLGSLLTVSVSPISAIAQDEGDGPVVQTAEGPVRGFIKDGVYEFLGIPYAAPPISTEPTAAPCSPTNLRWCPPVRRSEEHTSELQSRRDLVCRLLLEKKNFTPT